MSTMDVEARLSPAIPPPKILTTYVAAGSTIIAAAELAAHNVDQAAVAGVVALGAAVVGSVSGGVKEISDSFRTTGRAYDPQANAELIAAVLRQDPIPEGTDLSPIMPALSSLRATSKPATNPHLNNYC